MEGTFLILLLVFSLTSTLPLDDDMKELAATLRESCGEESGVDLSLVENINKGAKLTPDPKLKCYMKCIFETAGIFGDDQMDVDALMGILPEDFSHKIEDSLRACGTIKGTDDCDTVYQTQVCWQQKSKDLYFLV